MKKNTLYTIFTFAVLIALVSSFKPLGTPAFEFDKTVHDFGDITEGDVVSEVFNFKNTGDGDLYISRIISPCGCTVPEYKQNEPIKPGESSEIKVQFNSRHKSGKQNKVLTILSNVPGVTTLKISCNVLPKPATTPAGE